MVASSHTLTVTTPSDREIVMTRTFDAPRGLVWEALSKPEHMREWWGPRGFTMPVCEIDLRVGGWYRYVWRNDGDGREFGMDGEHREIVASERVVTIERSDGGEVICTLALAEQGGRTTLTHTMLFATPESRDQALQSGMTDGMGASYDGLEKLIAEQKVG